jgi:ABC-type sugar transport system, periplasmic component
MKKPLFIALCLLALLASCDQRKKKLIAVVPKATSHVFWLSVQAGAAAAGEQYGVEVLWNGPTQETEYSRQIQIVDSMVARRVDGIAVAAAERKALVQSIDRATAAGIPVTIFDSGLDSENYMSYVATDNVEAGRLAARTLAELLGGAGDVAMIMHAPGSASTMDRERGFVEVIEKEFPKIRIVARQFGQSDRAKAMAAAENILTAHPKLDGLFASSEPSSVGAALAIKARGLSGKVKFVTFDSSDSMVEDLRGGTIDAMVVQDAFRIGFEAVRTLAEKIKGGNPPKRIDLPARVITKKDLEDPAVQKLLSPDLKKLLPR